MAQAAQWPSTSSTTRSNHDRSNSSTSGEKRDIWSTLLQNVASGKKLPEKNLIVLGGSQETQKNFIDSLAQEQTTRLKQQDRTRNRRAPVANQFALGYTYQNVYDIDQDDMLARLSIYTLNDPSPAYAPLLARLMTTDMVANTTIAILLDWSEPWKFGRSLRAWIRLIRRVVDSLPQDVQEACDDNNRRWLRNRDAESGTAITDSRTSMPLGPGEYDEPLGLPVMVVCQNALAIEQLEKERGYRESHFDYILQFLRTVLLKHGAGLIYTMPSQPGQLQSLVHHMLDISTNMPGERLARDKADKGLKHNVVDRERVMVPPGWDSRGKIRMMGESFDFEGVSRAWSVEIQQVDIDEVGSVHGHTNGNLEGDVAESVEQDGLPEEAVNQTTVALYEAQIQDPRPPETPNVGIEVNHKDDQTFLAEQLARLESFRAEDDTAKKQRDQSRRNMTTDDAGGREMMQDTIGPVQFNMGGIQYDADEALKRIKERTKPVPTAQSTPERTRTRESTPFTPNSPPQFENGKDIPVENLEAYFASLMKGGRGGPASATNSPRVTSSPRAPTKDRESSGL